MARDFYPFVEKDHEQWSASEVHNPARIAVYDDAAAAPRVVVVEPQDVRSFLEEITATVNKLSHEQGGNIPFMVIREIVENFIHAYFQAPTITILDGGNTIRFSDQGPGIKEKNLALEYGTSSATEEMKHYIRGVGSGLPYAQQYMEDKGGSLEIEDNIAGGTVVTISTRKASEAREVAGADSQAEEPQVNGMGAQMGAAAQMPQAPGAMGYGYQAFPGQQQAWQQGMYAQPGMDPYAAMQQGGQAPYGQQAYPQAPAGYGFQQFPAYAPQAAAMQPQGQAQAIPGQAVAGFSPAQAAAPERPALSSRQESVMEYLAEHDSCGPTDLTQVFGSSSPTWSRELKGLMEMGIITKSGQKYRLTTIGRSMI